MFLTRVWHLDLDFDMVTALLYTHIQLSALYLDFQGATNIHVLSPDLWLLGFLIKLCHLDHDYTQTNIS